MAMIFLVCTVIGGTVLVMQFLLTLVGMADVGGELVDDLPSDAEISADGLHDGPGHSHVSDWLFGVLSFRTVIAFLTFFGLAGMAALSANLSPGAQWIIALATGLGAMYGMHALMRGMQKLTHDGTLRLERAIGKTGTVYLAIPANRTGEGKIQIAIQERLMDLVAVTPVGAKLPQGAKVIVTAVIDGETVEVEPLLAEKPVEDAASAA
jgi:hypothetical protein